MKAEELEKITLDVRKNRNFQIREHLDSKLNEMANKGLGYLYISVDCTMQGPFGPTVECTRDDIKYLMSNGFKVIKTTDLSDYDNKYEFYKVIWYEN